MLKFSKGGDKMEKEKKPFNDVIDHLNKIEGNATNSSNAKLKNLPGPLKFFGYFVIGFFSITILFIIIANFLD